MSTQKFRQRPLLTLPQLILLAILIVGLFIAVDLNRRAQAGRLAGIGKAELEKEISFEATRQANLIVTRAYVNSDDYVADFARNESGLSLPGEVRVVPLFEEKPTETTSPPVTTLDSAFNARPWQAWLRLLTDWPIPEKN